MYVNHSNGSGGSFHLVFRVAALAAAVLLLEGSLLRLLAVAQFYHFAFLVVSLALLGFGASGTLLSLSPSLRHMPLDRVLTLTGFGFAASVVVTYVIVNTLPFDSYSIAWERRQLLFFVLYYLALTLPFLVGGLGIGAALAAETGRSHIIYSANLAGSAGGALLAPLVLWWAGVPGAVTASVAVGLITALARPVRRLTAVLLLLSLLLLLTLGITNQQDRSPVGIAISPYKGLAHALRYPGAQRIFGSWNAIARVDVIADAGTRLLPGLSYQYPGVPPPQVGISIDAGSLQPISLITPESFDAAAFLGESLPFQLKPKATALVLEPGGGLGVLQALAGGATRVTAVVGNKLERSAVARAAQQYDVYAKPRVQTFIEDGRVFVQRDTARYEIVFLPLTDAYQPVTSGAYSLAESYDLTVEAFKVALERLEPDGIFVATRWLQTPPSESVRTLATLRAALVQLGVPDPAEAVVAYRSLQTITFLIRPGGWDPAGLARVRSFTEALHFDLVWAPDMDPAEANRFNRLPEAAEYEAARALLTEADLAPFFADYPFAVTPVTDDHPFFFHFFTWRQTPEVLASLGRTWQPFGGSGYFLLLALLALVLLLSLFLILFPLLLPARSDLHSGQATGLFRLRALGYFGALGIAFLFVEIPLIQRWILLLGHATYAFAAVVITILLGSSLGSLAARASWLPRRTAFGVLVLLALATPLFQGTLIDAVLGWPLPARTLAAAASLAPLAVLMGLPFPLGLAWLEAEAPGFVPWAWAINGCASVISGVLAAILALGYGFSVVLLLGAGAYTAAGAALFLGRHSQPLGRSSGRTSRRLGPI